MDKRITTILALAGVAFLLSGGIMLLWTIWHPARFVTADAVIVNRHYSDATGKVELLVRFEVDGKAVEKHTQPIRESRLRSGVGSRISVAYSRGWTLGLETWQVYADEDAESASRRVRKMNELAACAAILAGIGLLAAAVGIGRMHA